VITLATGPIGMRAGEYEITGVLGRGGMGTVYAGVHPVIGTEVAIKVIDPRLATDAQLLGRFLQEARSVNKIRHANIVDVFAFGESPDLGHYLVMPRLRGRTLGARLAQTGPMTVQDALPILREIAEALDAAHDAGVLHRDLKPDNVFLTSDRPGVEHVKVLDFGIAKLTDATVASTETGRQLGTPLFMSPEQWEGTSVDAGTDIYALGVLLHHVLTCRYPFEGDSPVRLMTMHLTHEPTPPSAHGAPAFVDAVVARALDKAPARRFATGRMLCDALAAAGAAHDPALAATMTPLSLQVPMIPRAAPRRRWWLALAGVAMAGVAAAATAFALARPARRSDVVAGVPPHDAAIVPATTGSPTVSVDAAPAPAPEPPPEPALVQVRLRLHSTPEGASVLLDGRSLGTTPLDARIPARERATLVVRRKGYETEELELALTGDVDRTVALARVSARPRPTEPAASGSGSGSGSGPGPGSGSTDTTDKPKEHEPGWGETVKPF